MDLLSRSMQFLVSSRQLKGVQIAPTAQPLTTCIYADDLLVFGSATVQEASLIMNTLEVFALASGQRIGPEKSHMWFSSSTPIALQNLITGILNVPATGQTPEYLGAPVQVGSGSHDFLIDRFTSKLSAWKSQTLSQAGRLIVIKATLSSIPVFYMSTSKLPVTVTNKLTAIMRSFFWGKKEGTRYIAYVAWSKITKPIEEGGLGVRDLVVLNNALLARPLWDIASDKDALWVEIVKAKYLPRSLLWQSKRVYKCTAFWRALMNLRHYLIPVLKWKLGDGTNCGLFGQPWCPYVVNIMPPNSSHRTRKVNEMLSTDGFVWDTDKLAEEFGYAVCIQIVATVSPPTRPCQQDTLVFEKTANGSFSVKAIYDSMRSQIGGVNQNQVSIWKGIWKNGNSPPRLKLFLWKLLHGALPLAAVLSGRGININPICQLCKQEDETLVHAFFHCNFARVAWFSSPLQLRTQDFPNSMLTVISDMIGILTVDQWEQFVGVLWAIWRSRNDLVYGGKPTSLHTFGAYLQTIQNETLIAKCQKHRQISGPSDNTENQCSQLVRCYADGSWTQDWAGGIGIVLYRGEELQLYHSAGISACCPLQAEACALLKAIMKVNHLGFSGCEFFTDSQGLSDICQSPLPSIEGDWRACIEVFRCWEWFRKKAGFLCTHVSRDQNSVADELAKRGRIEKWNYMGFTYPIFLD